MRRRGSIWALAVVALGACAEANVAEPEGLGLEAAGYLNFALDIMQFNSIRRYEIDWDEFRATTIEDAGNSKAPADTYPTIRRALERLGDNHSFFQSPDQRPSASFAATSAAPLLPVDPMTELIEPDIGYVEVPAFSGGGSDGDELASLYHRLIEEVDTTSVCGWVVDLRGNTGGNMWPMLAGVGPIIGEGVAGFFVDPDSLVNEWVYEAGVARIDETAVATADPFYAPVSAPPPVAVLTDAETASSGEAIAIAFRARDDARSFGESTFGVSTANAGFGLPDGAVIFLTVAWMADRSGEIYGQQLAPDEAVAGAKTGERASDPVLDAALTWLETSHCN